MEQSRLKDSTLLQQWFHVGLQSSWMVWVRHKTRPLADLTTAYASGAWRSTGVGAGGLSYRT